MDFREKLNELEAQLSEKFKELTKDRGRLYFVRPEEEDNEDALSDHSCITYINENGRPIDIVPIYVDGEKIVAKVVDNQLEFDTVELSFESLDSTKSRICLLEDIINGEFYHLCTCNGCGSTLIDENPQVDAPKYQLYGDEKEMVFINNGEDSHWACPICKTDEYLTDNI